MAFLAHLLATSKALLKGRVHCYSRLNNDLKQSLLSNKDKKGEKYDKKTAYAKRRLDNELWKSLSVDLGVYNCCYGPVDMKDPFHLQAVIIGPSNTPFDGGVFFLSIDIPHNYPFKPPKMKFLTKIFHPNVARDGTIHIDILSYNWTPALTIEKLLLSICSFLLDPSHEQDSCNSVCNLYWKQRKLYNKIAREWTSKYAML